MIYRHGGQKLVEDFELDVLLGGVVVCLTRNLQKTHDSCSQIVVHRQLLVYPANLISLFLVALWFSAKSNARLPA
jgi:hypothetical protein